MKPQLNVNLVYVATEWTELHQNNHRMGPAVFKYWLLESIVLLSSKKCSISESPAMHRMEDLCIYDSPAARLWDSEYRRGTDRSTKHVGCCYDVTFPNQRAGTHLGTRGQRNIIAFSKSHITSILETLWAWSSPALPSVVFPTLHLFQRWEEM